MTDDSGTRCAGGSATAGRDLDVDVAKKVFGRVVVPDWPCEMSHDGGWMVYNAESHSRWSLGPEQYSSRQPVYELRRTDGTLACHDVVPRYSTDIADAWQVVEKLKRDGAKIDVQNRAVGWACHLVVWPGGKGERQVRGDGESAPEAICLAALKAVASPHAAGVPKAPNAV